MDKFQMTKRIFFVYNSLPLCEKLNTQKNTFFSERFDFNIFFFVNSYDLGLNKMLRLYNLVNNSTINATEFRNVRARI